MRDVSREYWETLYSNSYTETIRGSITKGVTKLLDITDSIIPSGGLLITKSSVSSDELEFGGVVISELSLNLNTNINRYILPDSNIELVYQINNISIRLGKFKIIEASRRTNNQIHILAYNELFALEKQYDNVSIGGMPYDLITTILEKCSLELSQSREEIEKFINGKETIQIIKESNCRTYRDCLKVVLQMLGAFADVTENGKVIIKQYSKEANLNLDKSKRFSSDISDYITKYNQLKIKGSGEDYFISNDKDIISGLEMNLDDIPSFLYGVDDVLQKRCDNLFKELKQIIYTPSKFITFSIPILECGDMINLIMDDSDVNTLITSITWEYRGNTHVESVGKNPYFSKKAVDNSQSPEITKITEQINKGKIVFHEVTNIRNIKIKKNTTESLGTVIFTTTDETSVIFLGEISLIYTANDSIEKISTTLENGKAFKFNLPTKLKTSLTITYHLNDEPIHYQPIQDLIDGNHTINLYYGIHNINKDIANKFEIRLSSSEELIEIPKFKFKGVIFGQGLSKADKWNGEIFVEDYFGDCNLSLNTVFDNTKLIDDVNIAQLIPVIYSINDRIGKINLHMTNFK